MCCGDSVEIKIWRKRVGLPDRLTSLVSRVLHKEYGRGTPARPDPAKEFSLNLCACMGLFRSLLGQRAPCLSQ